MRHRPTEAERALWRILQNRQLGVRFLRQHVIGCFIVDFFSFASKLVIEVDGNTHFDPAQIERDAMRTSYLRTEGYSVLRFTNADILFDIENVQKRIAEFIKTS